MIDTAAPELRVFVSLYSLKDIQRSDTGRKHLIDNSYQDFSQLVSAELDAVIVTGAEPKEADLKDEPFWLALTNLLDWIDREGPSSAFSCLASHAAVLHYDGIERRLLADKCFGLFEHATLSMTT